MKDLDQALADLVCPITDCTASIAFGQLACRRHWFMVPRELRAEVWQTWRSFLWGTVHPDQLRHVQQRALEAVEARL